VEDLARHRQSAENTDALHAFAWQAGYGVFTVSKSQERIVKKEDFNSELLRLLRAHEIEVEER